ncbi:hypothetical protein Dimus_018470, partial [Dionaea muscipula]
MDNALQPPAASPTVTGNITHPRHPHHSSLSPSFTIAAHQRDHRPPPAHTVARPPSPRHHATITACLSPDHHLSSLLLRRHREEQHDHLQSGMISHCRRQPQPTTAHPHAHLAATSQPPLLCRPLPSRKTVTSPAALPRRTATRTASAHLQPPPTR